MKNAKTLLVLVSLNISAVLAAGSAWAADDYGGDRNALLAGVPEARHTLADAIGQVSQGDEVATVAKLEYEDGALHLAVYTSANGLGLDAEHNQFKEYNGDSMQGESRPDTEIFKDFEHIARAAAYHTLMSITRLSLLDMIGKAKAISGGRVLWVRPIVDAGRPVFDVGVERDHAFRSLRFDLVSGQPIE